MARRRPFENFTTSRQAGPGRGDQRRSQKTSPDFVVGGSQTQDVQCAVRAVITLDGWRGKGGRGDLMSHIGHSFYIDENGKVVDGDAYEGMAVFIMNDIEAFMNRQELGFDRNNPIKIESVFVATETTRGWSGRSIVLLGRDGRAIAQSEELTREIADNADLFEEIKMLLTATANKPRKRSTERRNELAARPTTRTMPVRKDDSEKIAVRVRLAWDGQTGNQGDLSTMIDGESIYIEDGEVISGLKRHNAVVFQDPGFYERVRCKLGLDVFEETARGVWKDFVMEHVVILSEYNGRGSGRVLLTINDNGKVIDQDDAVAEKLTKELGDDVEKLLTTPPRQTVTPRKSFVASTTAAPAAASATVEPQKPMVRKFGDKVGGGAKGLPSLGTVPVARKMPTAPPAEAIAAAVDEAFEPPRAKAADSPKKGETTAPESGANGASDGGATSDANADASSSSSTPQ